jgi:pSer/pThr/pTyr-binding forkhead associated (FHA) protein
MPSLRVTQPGRGVKIHPLHKKITSIGRSEENDIALDDPLLDPSHIHIHFDGRDFNVTRSTRAAIWRSTESGARSIGSSTKT